MQCALGVFGRESTRSILKAGAALGLSMNFHGDEINPMQSGELAGEVAHLSSLICIYAHVSLSSCACIYTHVYLYPVST